MMNESKIDLEQRKREIKTTIGQIKRLMKKPHTLLTIFLIMIYFNLLKEHMKRIKNIKIVYFIFSFFLILNLLDSDIYEYGTVYTPITYIELLDFCLLEPIFYVFCLSEFTNLSFFLIVDNELNSFLSDISYMFLIWITTKMLNNLVAGIFLNVTVRITIHFLGYIAFYLMEKISKKILNEFLKNLLGNKINE